MSLVLCPFCVRVVCKWDCIWWPWSHEHCLILQLHVIFFFFAALPWGKFSQKYGSFGKLYENEWYGYVRPVERCMGQVFEVEHLHISIFTTSWQQEIHWAACMQLNWMYCHSHCDCKFLEKGQQCPFCKNYAEKKWKLFLPFVNIFHENCYLEVTSMMVPMCSPFQLIMICHDLISTFTLKKICFNSVFPCVNTNHCHTYG